ncbi:MAG: alpha/beta fold hydrolase [Deinococcota bacterium]
MSLDTPFQDAPFQSSEHQPFVLGKSPHKALLIHGFPGTPAEMRPLAEMLVSQGYEAHGLLLPGFGKDIGNLGQQTRHDWITHALSAWENLQQNAETVVLIGFSMGAAIALHVAAQSNHKPHRLMLIAPFWRFNAQFTWLLAIMRYLKPSLKPFAKADFNDPKVLEQFSSMFPDADLDNSTVQDALKNDIRLPSSALDELRRLGLSARNIVKQIQQPCLVIQGAADEVATPANTRELMQNLPTALTYSEIPDATHDVIKAGEVGHDKLLECLSHHLK